ncbi:hypothetical protein ASE85_20370 [Sphingobium sp. Leaf26]|uniref:hypothetical protein n=1 Tax=Sphingobium sp. Leaf26 TaxID=1735693 RepID=UPI0006F42B58|nr:hypothetical protein [Sphingobium sp. Leaf26]KQN05263.1 hypothetical protein ASE85_20370 [Sphingobium sp. Leaf26]
MEWVIAIGLTIVLAAALPRAIVAAKKSVRGNRRMAGVALSIGLAFSFLHDPRKQEVIENIAKRESDDADRDHQSGL